MRFRTGLAGIALATLGTLSQAGGLDAPVTPAPVPAVPTAPSATDLANEWTGFYAGGQVITGDATDATGLVDDTDVSGFGLHAGYLFDTGSFVVGGEIDYDALTADTGTLEGDVNVLRLKGIAGYDLGPFLPYVTAGQAHIDAPDADVSDTVLFYGLGGSYAVTDQFRLGAEFLRHQGDDFDGTGADLEADTFSLRGSFNF